MAWDSQKGGGLLSKRKDRGSVTLDFEVDGRVYQVTRGLIRRNGAVSQDSKRSYLWEDGVEEPLSPTDLKQRILKILEFNEPPNPPRREQDLQVCSIHAAGGDKAHPERLKGQAGDDPQGLSHRGLPGRNRECRGALPPC